MSTDPVSQIPVLAALLEGMRRAEANRARASSYSGRLQDEIGGSYGTLDDARRVAERLLADPAAAERLGHAGVVTLGEVVCIVWNRVHHDRDRMYEWFRQVQPPLAGRSPYACIQAGDVDPVLALLQEPPVA